MSPPFDALLSEDRSPLFAKVMKHWNKTMELVNSKVNVFTQLILDGVGSKEQLMLNAMKEWEFLARAGECFHSGSYCWVVVSQ
jgi:hypothetical protein